MNRPVISNPGPQGPVSTGQTPARLIIARIIAMLLLMLTNSYTAVVTMRLANFFCELIFGHTFIDIATSITNSFLVIDLAPFDLLPPIALWLCFCMLISPLWILLNDIFGGCCEGANSIMLGLVEAWPQPVDITGFFSRLKFEAKTDVENTVYHREGPAILNFLRSPEPQLTNRLQAAIYLSTAVLYRLYIPATDSIVHLFWRVAMGLGIVYVAYFMYALPAQFHR